MDICLHDILFQFMFHHHPDFLNNPEAFDKLVRLIHVLLSRQRIEQNRRTLDRLTKVSSC